ncbi:MAG: cupin domain-containing protein [Pseudodesulfovibrio sp.]|nr:cupin domain-containing protein [Pseudodesulfovibrio sp.]
MKELELDLGMRLKYRRQLKRLRLSDLALKVGCSESMLSKIENGKATPSLGILNKMASALDISVRSLFAEHGDVDVVCRKGHRPLVESSTYPIGSGIELEAIVPHSPDLMLQADIYTIAPGAGAQKSFSHEGQEAGYILKGTLELIVEEKTYFLQTGDSFFFQSDRLHSYCNRSNETTRVIWINTQPHLGRD